MIESLASGNNDQKRSQAGLAEAWSGISKEEMNSLIAIFQQPKRKSSQLLPEKGLGASGKKGRNCRGGTPWPPVSGRMRM